MTGSTPRRRRRREQSGELPPARADGSPQTADSTKPPAKTHRRSDDRGWRDLIGSGPSQVGISAALRARDVARPNKAELAEAEDELVIVRRLWKPPED